MRQVMFEANENVSSKFTYWMQKEDLKGYVSIEFLNGSFLVNLPDGATPPTEEELIKGITVSDYVEWETIDGADEDTTVSVGAHVYGKPLSTQQYNLLVREIITKVGNGGIEKILSEGFELDEMTVKINGSTKMTVGEEVVNAPVQEPVVSENEETPTDPTV